MTSRPQLYRTAHNALLAGFVLVMASGTTWAHEGGLGNAVMWKACDGRKIGDPCSFQNVDHDTYRGTCQSMANALVCVRNQPIERAADSPHTHQSGQDPGTKRQATRWRPWGAGAGVPILGGLAIFRKRRVGVPRIR